VNGVRDPGEAGIAGVTLTILSPCDAVWEAHTDPRGHYVFANIGCQILGVQIVQPDFPLHTTPNPFLFPAGTTPGTVDFGVARGR
jgi:hypothetical protein